MNIEVGTDLLCIKSCKMKGSGRVTTTFGKYYEILKVSQGKNHIKITIRDDDSEKHFFPLNGKWFSTVKEYRRMKLEKLGEVVSNQEVV